MTDLTEKEKEKVQKEAITIIGNTLKLHGRDMGKETSEEITLLVNMFQEGVRYAMQKNKEITEQAMKDAEVPF